MIEFDINGHQYRTAKLGLFDQLKVSRKLLPVMASVLGEIRKLSQGSAGGDTWSAIELILPKVACSLSAMSDEDANSVIFPCLSVVSRKHGKSWVPVFAQGEIAFDDIDMVPMLEMVARVVGDSLGSFFQERPASETVAQ